MTVKNILLQVKHKNEIYDLYTRTNAQSVIVDAKTGETLKDRLATIASMVGQGVDEKISQAISDLVNGAGDPAKLDTIKDLVDWINEHQDEYQDLIGVTSELRTALEQKIADEKLALQGEIASTKTELEGKLSAAKTDLEGQISSAKQELETAIAGIAEDVVENSQAIEKNAQDIAALDEKLDLSVPQDGEGVLVRRNGANQWEQIFNVVEELPSVMNEGQLFCVLLEDDPVASVVKADGTIAQYATVEEALTQAEAGETIRLTEDVTIDETVEVADGVTIIADGKVIVC